MTGVLELGPIEAYIVHYGEDVLRPLCEQAGEPMKVRTLNAATTDRTKVTCEPCIEWLHA